MTDGMLDLTLSASPITHPSHDVHPLWRRHGLARRHVHEQVDFTGRTPATVIMSNGNGVDSAVMVTVLCCRRCP